MNEFNKKKEIQEEQIENLKSMSSGKGTRTTRVSGDQLKSKLKSGEIPN